MTADQKPEKITPTFDEIREGSIFTTKMRGKLPEQAIIDEIDFKCGIVELRNPKGPKSFRTSLMKFMLGKVGRSVVTNVVYVPENPEEENLSPNIVEDPPTVLIYSNTDPNRRNPEPTETIMTDENEGRITLALKSNPNSVVCYITPAVLLKGKGEHNRYNIVYGFDVKPGEELPTPTANVEIAGNQTDSTEEEKIPRLSPLSKEELENMQEIAKTETSLPVTIYDLNKKPIFPDQRCRILRRLRKGVVEDIPAIYRGLLSGGRDKFVAYFHRQKKLDNHDGSPNLLIESEVIPLESLLSGSGEYVGVLREPSKLETKTVF